ncbi:protein BatD [Stutzerimonas stutzeri]|uniref:Protein BatD n=1 Tax=Stutzerimonas stutzeri TaxID=316 RepID=W8RBY6_STUST|nr:BatD family protein [Stutzerimonas stutzeri]AHL75977.1 protein BatD [Stutzerimonas stutzeri]MCQ4330671.1 BatD family protein [Stutzerimonas stutzeri]
MMRLMTLVFLLLLGCQASAAALTARVDRTQLSLDEMVELTLETADATVFGKPDLQPLDSLFKVLGTRQDNQLSGANGEARAITRWLITLQPRQTGYVIIPPLQLGDWHSEPITLNVSEPNTEGGDTLAPIFIDSSLDHDSVYVQAQVVLTLRIYHSVSLYDDSTLSPLQMSDALVERLGEPRTYEKDINGIRHGVIEIRYALFPQKSGTLNIPAQLFSATTVAGNGDYYGSRFGKSTQVKSPEIPLQVKPKPAGYPADAPWLPATNLTLVEAWSPQPQDAQLGEALTRSLLVKAEGLSSAQLPPVESPAVSGLRRYPDQPSLNDAVSENGVSGSREQREALVATRAGELLLPPVELVWWNTVEDRLERSTLPERALQIADNPELQQPSPEDGETPQPQAQAHRLWPWQLSSALLALTTLLGFGLWLRARSQPAVIRTVQSGPTPRSLLDDLKRACLANDTQTTRHALDAWARQQPETLADMAARFVPLSDALDGLNGALYSETGQRWQGEALWQAIQSLPTAQPDTTEQETGALPPLYPR